MPNPHFTITITKRSEGRAVVADATYQSGSRLFSEYDQKYKDYTRKQGIAYTEILLPANAPPEYADRQTDYCNEFFVSKGMCCDFAIHDPDPPGHNTYCHVIPRHEGNGRKREITTQEPQGI